jgi:alkanesulfonate monooxygenase SsuD/methylene tetrahydromethanopterin reductase-like flavin-dependent oxidoreductase (luciferase family)
VVVGGPILSDDALGPMLDDYRSRARAAGGEPYVIVSADVLIADSPQEARELALPEAWAMAVSRTTGEFPALEPAEPGREMTGRQRTTVERTIARTVHGTEDAVAEQLDDLVTRAGADELLASSSTFDRAALADSDARLARLLRRH